MNPIVSYEVIEGVAEITGTVLAMNTTMLDMCRRLGFRVETEPDDPSVRQVTLKLR